MLLVERFYSKPQIIEATATKLPDGVLLRLVYPVCNIGELNANKRMYERELWDIVLANQDLQEKLSNRNLYGQAEHPKETQSDLQLTSHIIHEMWIADDHKVYQTFDVLDTPCGRIIECLVRAGSRVGVSTRAEGDLEEAVGADGEKFHRVVPKSYRYVTTDFTADPSTFGVIAVDVKRNIITAARSAAESKNPGEVRFARQILESMQCDHKHACQNCGACKCLKGEGLNMKKSTVAEQIKSGKLTEGKAVKLIVKTEIGETMYTHAAVKKITEGRMEMLLNAQDPNTKMLTVDGASRVEIKGSGEMCIYPENTVIPEYTETEAEKGGEAEGEMAAENLPPEAMKGLGAPGEEITAEEMSALQSGPKPEAFKEEELPESKVDEKECSAKAKRMVKHIKKSEEEAGKSAEKAKEIAYTTVNKQKSEGKVPSDVDDDEQKIVQKLTEKVEGLKSISVGSFESRAEGVPTDYVVFGIFEGDQGPITLVHANDEAKAMEIGKNIAALTKVPFEGKKDYTVESKVNEDGSETGDTERLLKLFLRVMLERGTNYKDTLPIVSRMLDKTPQEVDALVDQAIKSEHNLEGPYANESKVNETTPANAEEQTKLLKLVLRVEKEKHVDLDGAIPIVARMIDETPEETEMLIELAIESGRSPDRREELGAPDREDAYSPKGPYESKILPLDTLIDLRIKEACTRAERDSLLEATKGHSDIQVRIISKKLQAATDEVAGLRTMVEKKAAQVAEATKAVSDTKKLDESMKVQHVAHQQELVKAANDSIREGRMDVLKDYFDRRLSACRLQADDNTQALLEKCHDLGDVDQLIESLVQVARRGALHPRSLGDMVVHDGRAVDPEQDKVDKQIGGLMRNWSA